MHTTCYIKHIIIRIKRNIRITLKGNELHIHKDQKHSCLALKYTQDAGTIKLTTNRIVRLNKYSELVITCEHGPRAMMAAWVLARYGYCNIRLLEGHMLGWRRADLPLEI